MRADRILILGGTREGRELAAGLIAEGHDVITSLAGITSAPVLPDGTVRRGGFGGSEGLAQYLRTQAISTLIDATHPFAAQMSRNAQLAAQATGVRLLRLERPPWVPQEGDNWISMRSATAAAMSLPEGARVLLTIGRKEAGAFFTRSGIGGVARMIEPAGQDVPAHWKVVLERPPFAISDEVELMTRHHITHLVTKNAGGEDSVAKLCAARTLSIPVVMIERPEKPSVRSFSDVRALIQTHGAMLLP
jgi:precorrin-6A/cobalt-precorrin-6A reductase